MGAQETINKLQDALSKLVEAYKQLQVENENLKKENSTLEHIKTDLEYKLQEYESDKEQQVNKIEDMISFVQSVVSSDDKNNVKGKIEDKVFDNNKDIGYFDSSTQNKDDKDKNTNDDLFDRDKKLNLDRVESLLGNFNK